MKILILANFTDDPELKGNNRFNYLAELLSEKGHEVTLVTSTFSHTKKQQRFTKDYQTNYRTEFIYEPGYKRNISVKRVFSHLSFNRNLRKFLKVKKTFDVVYCSFPTIETALTGIKYSKEQKIKSVVDIQDLWPEAYSLIIKNKTIYTLLFSNLIRKANWVYKNADHLVSVSQTYLDRAQSVSEKKYGTVTYLGTDLSKFDKYKAQVTDFDFNSYGFYMGYVGTLGHSYDLTGVFDAMNILPPEIRRDIAFVVMGDGPLFNYFKEYSAKLDINVIYTGRLSYDKMCSILSNCDIAVNAIVKGAAQSIINKHADYCAAALPIINTQECSEYRALVDEFVIGLNSENNNPEDLASKIKLLYFDKEMCQLMGENSRKLAELRFDRQKTYPEIVKVIEENC